AIAAISSRSRFEQWAKRGTPASSAIFGFRVIPIERPRALGIPSGGRYSREVPVERTDALIVDVVRSPIGKKNGTLSHIRGDDLSAQVVNALVARNDVDPAEVEDLQWGCVTQIEEQAWNIGRTVAAPAGWTGSVC